MFTSKTNRFFSSLLVSVAFLGCSSKPSTNDSAVPSSSTTNQSDPQSNEQNKTKPEVASPSAEELLSMRLSSEEARDGWVRLFDGFTLFGLTASDDVEWEIRDQALHILDGPQTLICTSTKWKDFELSLEFKAASTTNSGIFLRTPRTPKDPASDCYELNIAPTDNPFPTGSLVKRLRVEPDTVGNIDPEAWHRYDIRVLGDSVRVSLNGQSIVDYVDPEPLPAGHIGLQHNEGEVAFRDIRIRPLSMNSLLSDSVEENWIRHPDLEGDFQMSDDGLHVTGGRGQLESKEVFGNFKLLAEVRTNAPDLNSGFFFRCIPGQQMMGYECQVSNAIKGGDPKAPADCGTGGFFRRQDARIVAAQDQDWFSLLLNADEERFAAWVNGLQVSDWTDDRSDDENPRKGLRLSPGSLMIQAHDPTTDIHIRSLSIGREDLAQEWSLVAKVRSGLGSGKETFSSRTDFKTTSAPN